VAEPLRPPLAGFERGYQAAITLALGAFGFVVLFSTAGTSVVIALLLLVAVARPSRVLRTRPWREPIHAIGLLLLAYIVGRTFLAEGSAAEAFNTFRKYHELLLVPLLWAVMRNARRPQAFAIGLVLSAVLFCVAYWVGAALDLGKENRFGFWLHLHRSSAGFGLAVCAFLLVEHGRLRLLPRGLAFGTAAFLAATVLFALDGRTGHAVLLLLMLCSVYRAAPPRTRTAGLLLALCAAAAIGAASSRVRDRVLETINDAQSASQGVVSIESPTAIRVEIWRNAWEVAAGNWTVGTGWQAYQGAADAVAQRRHGGRNVVPGSLSDNPHNEYLMQFASGGLPALLLYLLWLAWPVVHAIRVGRDPNSWAGAAACVAIAFAVASLFNSLLLDYIEAHFYAAILAWLLVRRVER
jgi:O-antigen ligase